jgi:hypothetical protein
MSSEQYPRLALVASYFPDFEKWLAGATSRRRYMEWAETALAEIDVGAIEKACQWILERDSVRNQRLPFAVAEKAKAIQSLWKLRRFTRIADGHPTMACRVCEDTGYVEILDPSTVAQTVRTGQLPAFPYTVAAVCTCGRGQAILHANEIAEQRFKRNLIQYNPAKHIQRRVGVLPMDQYSELLGSASAHGDVRDMVPRTGDVETVVERLADATTLKTTDGRR